VWCLADTHLNLHKYFAAPDSVFSSTKIVFALATSLWVRQGEV
jgi:hypothetical protein